MPHGIGTGGRFLIHGESSLHLSDFWRTGGLMGGIHRSFRLLLAVLDLIIPFSCRFAFHISLGAHHSHLDCQIRSCFNRDFACYSTAEPSTDLWSEGAVRYEQ